MCYPETKGFTTPAVSYGRTHEEDAKEAYKSTMVEHQGFSMRSCGLIIDKDVPYLGASPDALVECACCGGGVLEVKCPWSAQDLRSLNDAAKELKNFCLKVLPDGSLHLSKDHPFYLQCQLQMHVTHRNYCDFVVWHPTADIHLERIKYEADQLMQCLTKAEQFFKLCVLPELTGKWYTQSRCEIVPASSQQQDQFDEEDDGSWCYCKESKGGEMVGCESKSCPIKWFHLQCLGMTAIPVGRWLCPSCFAKSKGKQTLKSLLKIK